MFRLHSPAARSGCRRLRPRGIQDDHQGRTERRVPPPTSGNHVLEGQLTTSWEAANEEGAGRCTPRIPEATGAGFWAAEQHRRHCSGRRAWTAAQAAPATTSKPVRRARAGERAGAAERTRPRTERKSAAAGRAAISARPHHRLHLRGRLANGNTLSGEGTAPSSLLSVPSRRTLLSRERVLLVSSPRTVRAEVDGKCERKSPRK